MGLDWKLLLRYMQYPMSEVNTTLKCHYFGHLGLLVYTEVIRRGLQSYISFLQLTLQAAWFLDSYKATVFLPCSLSVSTGMKLQCKVSKF